MVRSTQKAARSTPVISTDPAQLSIDDEIAASAHASAPAAAVAAPRKAAATSRRSSAKTSAASSPKAAPKSGTRAAKGSVLSAADLAELEQILREDRARAMRSARAHEDTLAEELAGAGRGGDVVDQSSDLALRELATVQASRESSAVRVIDDALERIRKDPASFGLCQGCGDDIPMGRLLTIPTATCCVRCAHN